VDVAPDLNDLQHLIASGNLESAREKYRLIADQMQGSSRQDQQLLLEFYKAQILGGEDQYPQDLNLRAQVARCHLLLSSLLLRTGDYQGAKAHAEAVVYFATWEIDDTGLKGDAHTNLGLALKNLGGWREAERHLREAVEAYRSGRDEIRNLRASLNLAILLRKVGKVAEAADIFKEGMQRARRLAVPIGICRYGLELATLAVIERDADEGRRYLRIAREATEAQGYQRERILALEIDGQLSELAGDLDRALDVYLAGLDLARVLAKEGDLESELLRRAGGICLQKGRIPEGRRFIDEALVLSRKVHDAYGYGICLRILGQLELAGGLAGSGVGHLQDSARELGSLSPWSHELAVTELVLGKALLEQSSPGASASAVAHLLEARRIYSSLGISQAVRNLDEVIFSSAGVGAAPGLRPADQLGDARAASRYGANPGQYGIVTEDERLVGDLERWGPTEARILIEGETGVGKELMAKALHAMSRRREGPFVAVDCGALSETLADSELFGHARGAFTGAIRGRTGLVEAANGGTLFLDEIGELSEVLQVKLLRVLEESVVRRVGENGPRQVDVRVMSATARDLWAEVEAGRFRRDLYYRLKTVLIRVPSLRERPHDIDPLLDYYLQLYAERHGIRAELSRQARAALAAYSWPGNVRELKNVMEALVLSSTDGGIIEADQVAEFTADQSSEGLKDRIADMERDEIERVMKVCGGNRTKAARMLGISRKTLWQKLKQMGRK
jgi:tetratricopeptide (TPR) repeat protein